MDDSNAGELPGKKSQVEVTEESTRYTLSEYRKLISATLEKKTKRPRMLSKRYRRSFLSVIDYLGITAATPKGILHLMNDERLTLDCVENHLLDYRLYLRREKAVNLSKDKGNANAPKVFDEMSPVTGWFAKAKAKAKAKANVNNDIWLLEVDDDPNPEEGEGGDLGEEKEWIFSKALTPYDVSELNRMVFPKEAVFDCLSGNNRVKGLRSFYDPTGKSWSFRCRFWNCMQRYVLTTEWIHFVKEKQLDAGDTVHFYRGKNRLFISWSLRTDSVHPPLMPALVPDDCVAPNDKDSIDFDTLFPSELFVLFDQIFSDDVCPFDGRMVDDALLSCALFAADHEFEKDELVQLWILDGIFVHESVDKIIDLFFGGCQNKGYLQYCRTNLKTGKAMYRFKGDSSHLVRLLNSRDSHAIIKGISSLNDISPEVSHVSIRCQTPNDTNAFCGSERFKQLKTLILLQGHEFSFKQISRDFLLSLRQLRFLDLSRTGLIELPSSIGSMKCLCYLDLSYTPIKRLPEPVDCLKILQTLKLRGCKNLTILPKGTRKLLNLRHLEFDVLCQLRTMPQGMGELTNIQTLSAFLVGVEEGCHIRQLKNMNNLSGSFCISRLENVLTEDEAMEACLSKKSHITKLELHWSDLRDEDVVVYGKVLSSLRPNSSIEELHINCFGGYELPSWICDTAFSRLVSINLFKCENCLVLPSLGQLPSLKYLSMADFQNLKVIDHNFYGGCEMQVGISWRKAFRRLKRLTIENMLSLEEWTGIESLDFPNLIKLTIKHCPKLYGLCSISSLCSLESLEISHCTVLASLPDGELPPLVQTFIMEDCPMITTRILDDEDQYWHRVSGIPHVWIDHQEMSWK